MNIPLIQVLYFLCVFRYYRPNKCSPLEVYVSINIMCRARYRRPMSDCSMPFHLICLFNRFDLCQSGFS